MPYFAKTYGRIGATSTSTLLSANGGVYGLDQVRMDKFSLPLSITPLTTAGVTQASSNANAQHDAWWRSATHFVYTQAELAAAGWTTGVTISRISFNVAVLSTYPSFPSYAVGMCNTALTSGSSLSGQGLTTVRTPTTQVMVLGTNTITLTAPFAWNGTSNLGIALAWGSRGAYSFGYAGAGTGTSLRSSVDSAGTYLITDTPTGTVSSRPVLTLFKD
jgi:hypothetical protein